LRKLVLAKPALRDAVFEELERAIDRAVSVVFEGLRREDVRERLRAAAVLLRYSEASRRRDFGRRR
jgi:hypothetical protein